jgi:hypothetical protein
MSFVKTRTDHMKLAAIELRFPVKFFTAVKQKIRKQGGNPTVYFGSLY